MSKISKKIVAIILAVSLVMSLSGVAFATSGLNVPMFKVNGVNNGGGYVHMLKELYSPGELVTLKAVPYDGYVFYSWASDDVLIANPANDTIAFIMPAKSVTIGAMFAIAKNENQSTVAVNFDTMGGSEFNPVYVEIGQKLEKPVNVPVKDGYKFEGWYTDSICTLPYDFSTEIYSTMFLYAKWSPISNEPAYTNAFVDVKESDWFYSYVIELAEKNIVSGVGHSKFAPDNKISRAQLATILANLAGANLSKTETPFKDVPADSWYAKSVAWAYENGIVNGTSATAFAPEANVTRQDMAVMIMRYVNNVAKVTLETSVEPNVFKDDAKIESYAKEAVTTMQRSGIIGGKPGNIFDPKANATRAEACKMISVLLNLIEN